ncbi:type II secretory pathway predicted ATPase ExeA [Palleronia aestuarii]|uniref:Type II secretory pathway predicted ATPase ExeA n=1 Tax=Palleronia aestuarii TaxID=568105 RepID=A0A2W7PVF0_9RHOB|nr:AAA family ATPase [Palleronia aestuarii]PZX13509.1 type II secretory pathway predicted ATPase ExeA [Palleronia aestuarii]
MNSTIDIYTDHFQLTERPFSLVPDPDFLFWGPVHTRAYAILEYGIVTRAPITLITGEVGAGKTTLLHHLLRQIEDDVTIGLIANAHGSHADASDRGSLLRWVLRALDQPVSASDAYVDLFDRFQAYLIDEYANGRRVILIFDEAQNLVRSTLEELRMLTNINSGKDELLQLVLVGQPELRDTILQPDLKQFAQRVSASFHLSAMSVDTIRDYIAHRLAVAGGPADVFSDEACQEIHAQTGGVPRLVNQICDLAMVYAFTNNEYHVSSKTVRQIIADGVFFAGGMRNDPVRLVNSVASKAQ